MFCNKCGKEIESNVKICPNCGEQISNLQKKASSNTQEGRCLPSFILGLIGSIFGILGGICTTMCAFGSSSNAFFLIVGGSVVGLIGACKCLNNIKLGSVLEMAGALMIIFRAYSPRGGSDFMTVIGLVFLLAGALIGLVYAFILKRK